MAASRITPTSSKPSSGGSGGILAAPVSTLYGVGTDPERLALLGRLGIRTVGDLLWHLPRTHKDLSKVVPLGSLKEGEEQSAIAVIGRIVERRTQRGQTLTEAELLDEEGRPASVRATWFGRQFVKQRLVPGQKVRIAGKLKWFGRGLVFDGPSFEAPESEGIHTGRIVPVYKLTEGISDKQLRRWLHTAVEGAQGRSGQMIRSPLVDQVPEPLPAAVRERQQLPPIAEALKHVHFPDDPLALFRARRRLAFDELLTLQLATAQRRARWVAEANAIPLAASDAELDGWTARLPFGLTAAQRRSIAQIRADLAKSVPMSRLLEGDVGSGKTVVAALAMRIAVASGAQASLMAPTELLAEQHAATLSSLFGDAGPRVVLLTSSVKGKDRVEALAALATDPGVVAVGTHALLEEEVAFARLGLVVVDEQHRFGVRQRSTLRAKGPYPHVLLTTATPIPQTLWQTLNRDLDVSVLDEMPRGRQPIRTEVRTPDVLPKVWEWVGQMTKDGQQAFVVCPRIDPSDAADDRLFGESDFDPSAVATEEELRTGPLRADQVALVHGRMPQRERDAAMRRFRDREIDVLVATTVIEVGIDIPNATVMVVLGAERFGLAQLHQLRGRVGRGAARSFCILVSPKRDSERLAAMTETKRRADGTDVPLDGFDLAARDLEIRGPGQFLGAEQSGVAEQLRVVDLTDIDPRLLEDASAEADRIIAADPELTRPEHRDLREAVDELWRRYGMA